MLGYAFMGKRLQRLQGLPTCVAPPYVPSWWPSRAGHEEACPRRQRTASRLGRLHALWRRARQVFDNSAPKNLTPSLDRGARRAARDLREAVGAREESLTLAARGRRASAHVPFTIASSPRAPGARDDRGGRLGDIFHFRGATQEGGRSRRGIGALKGGRGSERRATRRAVIDLARDPRRDDSAAATTAPSAGARSPTRSSRRRVRPRRGRHDRGVAFETGESPPCAWRSRPHGSIPFEP